MKFEDAAFAAIHGSGLLAAEPPEKRDELIARFNALVSEIGAFLGACQTTELAKLRARKSELWQKGRKLEDLLKSLIVRIGSCESQLNSMEMSDQTVDRLNAAKSELLGTKFPTPAEIARREQQIAQTQAEIARWRAEQEALRNTKLTLQGEQEETQLALHQLLGELRTIDAELTKLQT